jgi:predicted membrane channel-forming protein YqfA (hemolysin III family)
MGIGVGIFLLAAGAILTFAVDATVNGLDIRTVGVILMIVGALGILLDLLIFAPRRRTAVTTTDGPGVSRTVRREDVF